MKIAFIGPGYGHNIMPYLNFLNANSNLHQVDFYFHGKCDFKEQYSCISFYPIVKKLPHLFYSARKYDVVWLMGGGRLLYIILPLKLFMQPSGKLVISPFGEMLPRKTTEKSIAGKITTWFLEKYDIIHCGWYGLADLLNPKLKKKVLLHVMGLGSEYFRYSESPDQEIVKLMEQFDKNTYNFYYPKSFLNVSRHDLVIKATKKLRDSAERIPPFKVYFLGGNEKDEKRYRELVELISDYNLHDSILFLQRTKFFKTEELNLLWENIDCGLQIAQHDGLSTTIFEPLINNKELIISDIPPYHYINDYFSINLELTPLSVDAIAEAMRKKVLGVGVTSVDEKEYIRNSIVEKYSFEKNIELLLNCFESFI